MIDTDRYEGVSKEGNLLRRLKELGRRLATKTQVGITNLVITLRR